MNLSICVVIDRPVNSQESPEYSWMLTALDQMEWKKLPAACWEIKNWNLLPIKCNLEPGPGATVKLFRTRKMPGCEHFPFLFLLFLCLLLEAGVSRSSNTLSTHTKHTAVWACRTDRWMYKYLCMGRCEPSVYKENKKKNCCVYLVSSDSSKCCCVFCIFHLMSIGVSPWTLHCTCTCLPFATEICLFFVVKCAGTVN